MYGISTQLALGLRVSGAHRTAGSVSRPLPARASGVRPAISLRQRMVDGQSAGNLPYLTLLACVEYENSVWVVCDTECRVREVKRSVQGLRAFCIKSYN